MGAAGVVETLLRTAARKLPLGEDNFILDAQVGCSTRRVITTCVKIVGAQDRGPWVCTASIQLQGQGHCLLQPREMTAKRRKGNAVPSYTFQQQHHFTSKVCLRAGDAACAHHAAPPANLAQPQDCTGAAGLPAQVLSDRRGAPATPVTHPRVVLLRCTLGCASEAPWVAVGAAAEDMSSLSIPGVAHIKSGRWDISKPGCLVLQAGLPWDAERVESATLPMALLVAVVRKEARLPEHTAAFAAAQLLPVIQAATWRHLAATQGQGYSLPLRKELLVSAGTGPVISSTTHQILTTLTAYHNHFKP